MYHPFHFLNKGILDILFHSESENNHGLYSNQDVDILLQDARVETDLVKRIDLYQKAEEIIVDDAGHSMLEKGIQEKLIEFTDKFTKY